MTVKRRDCAQPLSDAQFASVLETLLPPRHAGPICLAVSGGRDSMALMSLAAVYGRARNRSVAVFTVDHGLRAESAAEALFVSRHARALGLQHRTLRWERERRSGNLEAAARDGRYRLMAQECVALGSETLLVAHTLEDQAETVLMRLTRGSGVDGLTAMMPVTRRFGVSLLRPFLTVHRARLEARLIAEGLTWIDDPMNQDLRFTRVKLRRAAAVLGEAGLTPERLARTAAHMARARTALEHAAGQLRDQSVECRPEGYARLRLLPLLAAPQEIGLRVLAQIIMAVGGLSYPPRFERLLRLYTGMKPVGGLGSGRTLGGCRIVPGGDDTLMIMRESAALGEAVALLHGRPLLWDGRFCVELLVPPGSNLTPQVGALGREGLRRLRAERVGGSLGGLPSPVRTTLPSLWLADRLVAVPHLNYVAQGSPSWATHFQAKFIGL